MFSISSWSLVVLKWQKICYFKLQYIARIAGFFHAAEAYSESFKKSRTELFVKKINGSHLLTSLAKSSTQGFE